MYVYKFSLKQNIIFLSFKYISILKIIWFWREKKYIRKREYLTLYWEEPLSIFCPVIGGLFWYILSSKKRCGALTLSCICKNVVCGNKSMMQCCLVICNKYSLQNKIFIFLLFKSLFSKSFDSEEKKSIFNTENI